MRPRRRKVQFHCEIEDAQHNPMATSRIEGLTLKDLSLHVVGPSTMVTTEDQTSVADSLSLLDIDDKDDDEEKIRKLEKSLEAPLRKPKK